MKKYKISIHWRVCFFNIGVIDVVSWKLWLEGVHMHAIFLHTQIPFYKQLEVYNV